MANLTPKQQRFVEEYLIDLNATQAYIRAGYAVKNEDTAAATASKLLRNAKVQEAIQEAQNKRSERVQIDADYVLRRLVEIDQMDVLDIMDDNFSLKPISQWPKVWRQYISNIENMEEFEGFGEDREQIGWLKKIKWPDKVKNLELLGKHISVQAFKEQVKTEQTVEIKDYSNMSLEEAAEAYRKTMG